jgi:carboxylate-amine ligase
VEEEFHVVDLTTRYATPSVDALLDRLDGPEFTRELQRSQVETNSPVCTSLDELGRHLRRLRGELAAAAEPLGLGVVAAGTVPLGDVSSVSSGARFARLERDYQLLAGEQHICGAQVHVDVPDRDTAVQVVHRVAPHLPALLAITASSPYWQGRDSGYASFRNVVWSRWPTAGPPPAVASGAEYDALVADLIASGTIGDAGMVYFDVRPSAHLPTLELRIGDACPEVDHVLLVAGLFRALVQWARAEYEAGAPLPEHRSELLRAASWRAARSGLEGDLVDLGSGRPALVPPALLVGRLVDGLRPQLEELGDTEQVAELATAALARGSSAAHQRRAFGRRGELPDVVDALLAHTRGRAATTGPEIVTPAAPALLAAYGEAPFDEAVSPGGTPVPHYGWLVRALDRLGPPGLRAAEAALRGEQRTRGVTFRVGDGEEDRPFPLDLVPRIVGRDDWTALSAGLAQRVRALEAFLRDLDGERRIVADGVVPAALVAGARTPGPADAVRIAVAGIDVVRDRAERWLVLEDNLRVPSGLGYALTGRRLLRSALPELEPPTGVVGLEDVPARLRAALRSAAGPDGELAVLSAGPTDAAWYEHRLLADRMGVPLVTPGDLRVAPDGVCLPGAGGERRLSAVYRRIDEQVLLDASDATGAVIGPALTAAVASGAVALLNALGNGVGDDKLVYAHVPAMIGYYLGEDVLLPGVPTWSCADDAGRAEVLDRLDELVVKPVDGHGGQGVVIGPRATREELDGVAAAIRADPARWVAQQVVRLSTHPTHTDGRLEPRAVDLRAFVLQSRDGAGTRVEVLPAALSRVAPAGSMIVNSSRGGGAKDTWVLR